MKKFHIKKGNKIGNYICNNIIELFKKYQNGN